MRIVGIENMEIGLINHELQNGAKFIVYQYCISILILTFRRSSNIYFIRSNQGSVKKGLQFSLISFLFGWWGFPWGPIYTIGSFITNFKGGKNITPEVIARLNS